MKASSMFGTIATSWAMLAATGAAASIGKRNDGQVERRQSAAITPKVVIISMFPPEAQTWYGIPEFDLNARNVSVPGLSPLYPDVHCTAYYDICQLTIGESEINAATTITALWTSPKFDFTQTYFMIAGISGVNPEVATIGSANFARFAVQVGLQYEFDTRELPSNYSTGYIPFGAKVPGQYPSTLYGTEVFELNDALRQLAVKFAKAATLSDSNDAAIYRAKYVPPGNNTLYAAAGKAPSVGQCDVATSDVYYSGALLSKEFGNFMTLMTNGSAIYCTTAQEDNAVLESLMRGALAKAVDFSRIISLRTASNFDRPYPGQTAVDNLLYSNSGGFLPSLENIYLAGVRVVTGIVDGWNTTFAAGVKPTNYIGDIFGSLGGTPDFGPGFIPEAHRKRSVQPGSTWQKLNRWLES